MGEAVNKIQIGIYISLRFPIENSLKHDDGLSLELLVLIYAEYANLMRDDINIIERNWEVFIKTCKEIGLEVHME